MMYQPVCVLPASVIQVRQPRPVTTEPQTKGIADITGACNSTIARIALSPSPRVIKGTPAKTTAHNRDKARKLWQAGLGQNKQRLVCSPTCLTAAYKLDRPAKLVGKSYLRHHLPAFHYLASSVQLMLDAASITQRSAHTSRY